MEGGREDGEASRPHTTINSTTPPMAAPTLSAVTSALAGATSSPPLMHDQDSCSEAGSVDMDVSADDHEPEPEPSMPQPKPHANGTESAGAKRKLSDVITNGSSSAVHEPPNKRFKTLHFGVELWQNVFLHLSHATLARCLCVSKAFNACLTSVKGEEDKNGKKSRNKGDQTPPTVKKIDSNKIWANARKIWMPNMPRPLAGLSELAMLQLVGGRSCPFCQRKPAPSAPTYALDSGPGPDGVRVIWPFRIRACGNCLQDRITSQTDLLQTPAATLILGLPHIFLTNSLHYIAEMQRQAPGGMPVRPGVSILKVFYRLDIDQIVGEYEEAIGLNSGEDWRKGLSGRGKEAMADAARWEKWESQLVRGCDLMHTLREYDRSSFPEYFGRIKRRSAVDQHQQPVATGDGRNPIHVLPPAPRFAPPVQFAPALPPPQDMTYHQPVVKPEPDQSWTSQTLHKPASNPPVVEQRRQARKEEIERRCLELEPPLDLSFLPGMKSFQAAMQIAQPLTDQAWEALRPRLLVEKETIDLDAHHRAVQRAALEATMPSTADDTFLKPAKEIYDKNYDLAQESLRGRLVEYVDEHVNAVWNGNPRLDLDTSPVFAAKVILHAYQRYNEDKAAGTLPMPGVVSKTRGQRASPLQDPFLSLDNMKWLYENKIKPYVSDPQIFICAGCLEENPNNTSSPKWLAFEGLIQHYGAKHTTAFSKGNITVYWQTAAWPEDPPFHPQPEKFIKPTLRKFSGYKGRSNARNTPQPHRDGMFNAPGTQNGHFSNQHGVYANGHYGGAQAYPSQPYDQSNHQYGQYPGHNATDVSDSDKANQLAADLREVWDALEGVSDKEMLNCVRLQTTLHHAVSRFMDKYRYPPTLDLMTDALATNPLMQPIKAATGLACRQCVGSQTDGHQSYYGRIRTAKLYNTNSFINHYKMAHERNNGASAPLSTAMLELPERQMVVELPQAQGMDNAKLRLIAEAFPGAFVHPRGNIEDYLPRASSAGIGAPGGAGVASKIMDRLVKKNHEPPQSKKKKKGKRGSSHAPGARDGSQELALQEPQEHEYDPRNPMTSTEEEDDEAIAAKYDTDLARKKEPVSAESAAANAFSLAGLAPETLRALHALGSHSAQSVQQQPPADDGGVDRPPSVGRDDYVPAPQAPVPPPTSTNGTVQPDIAAILASLTGGAPQQPPTQPQVSTPTGTGRGSRDGSISRSGQLHPGVDQLYRSLSTSYNQDRPSTSGYPAYTSLPPQPAAMHYRPSADPPTPSPRYEMPGSDLQAALERNARHFSQNAAAAQPTPTPQQQPTYAPSPAYAQASPAQHVAPPRYKYVYDDHTYGQGQGQPAPVQYVQRAQQQQQTGYAPQPPQRTVYVDEHGREIQLIPIDAAPAPAPYAQQMQYGGYTGGGGGGYYEQPPGQGFYGGASQYGGGR